MEWNKEKTLLLIKEFHQRPGLWNMTHEDYRKKDTKRTLLEEIALKYNNCVTATDIERKFHTLRTQYHREINRINTSRGSEPYKSKWFAFNHLQFLNHPNACRNTKDGRRRHSTTATKILFVSNEKLDSPMETSTPVPTTATTVHNVQVTVAEKDASNMSTASNMRKDLRVLFEETVDSEDVKNEYEHVGDSTVTAQLGYVQDEVQIQNKIPINNSSGYEEEEHLVEEDAEQQTTVEPEMVSEQEAEYHQHHNQIEQQTLKIVASDRQASSMKRTHDTIYQDIIYETTQNSNMQTSGPVLRKVHKDAETIVTPTLLMARDEFSTFGECVANELRFLTDRQILVSAKHKINTALFEASLAQLQKNTDR